jgi:hypothetical protein
METSRCRKLALGIVVLLAAILTIDWVWTCGFSLECSVSREQAELIALQEVDEAAGILRFDPTIFRGPELVQTDDDGGFVFKWLYVDEKEEVELLVSVDHWGNADFGSTGGIDRLCRKDEPR